MEENGITRARNEVKKLLHDMWLAKDRELEEKRTRELEEKRTRQQSAISPPNPMPSNVSLPDKRETQPDRGREIQRRMAEERAGEIMAEERAREIQRRMAEERAGKIMAEEKARKLGELMQKIHEGSGDDGDEGSGDDGGGVAYLELEQMEWSN